MPSFLARLYAFKFFDAFLLIFPLYTVMLLDAGLTPMEISVCLVAWSGTNFALQVPAGVIADRWSRRYVLALAQLMRAAGFVVWLVWPHFAGFLAGLVLWGVKSAFTSGTFEALLFDELKTRGSEADYTRIFGRTRAVDSAGMLLAALGAGVAARWGYPVLVTASVLSGVLAFAAAASLPPAPPAAHAGEQDYLAHLRQGLAVSLRAPQVLGILVFSAAVVALGSALEEFWPIFGAGVGVPRGAIALFVGAQNAIQALAGLTAHRLERLATRVFYALLAVGGVMLLAAAALFTPPAMTLLALYSGLTKLIAVVFEGRLQHAVASAGRATIGSLKSLMAQIGVTALYLGVGSMAQQSSYRMAFLACGAATLAIGLASLALPRMCASGALRQARGAPSD
jgi:MFS family permease